MVLLLFGGHGFEIDEDTKISKSNRAHTTEERRTRWSSKHERERLHPGVRTALGEPRARYVTKAVAVRRLDFVRQ